MAFLPLENVSGDEKLEAWRTSFPQLVTMDLVQSRAIGSWNSGDLFLSLTDLGLWDVPQVHARRRGPDRPKDRVRACRDGEL